MNSFSSISVPQLNLNLNDLNQLTQLSLLSNHIRKSKLMTDDVDTSCHQVIGQSYENLFTYPWIRKRVEQDELRLHAWFFNIAYGDLIDVKPEKNLI